jgi:hypothetical protein
MPVTARLPASRLGRDIILALAAKAAALLLLWLFFFSPAHRPPADTARHIAGAR